MVYQIRRSIESYDAVDICSGQPNVHPFLSNLDIGQPSIILNNNSIFDRMTDPGVGGIHYYTGKDFIAGKDLDAGDDEIFLEYSHNISDKNNLTQRLHYKTASTGH